MARFAGGQVIVLAASHSYADGLPLIGWREHDRLAAYRVVRLPLLRTLLRAQAAPGPLGRLRLLLDDLTIRARVVATVLWLILFARVRAVCIGELVSAGWLFAALRLVPFVRRVVYMHGEEITTIDGYDNDFRRRRRYVAAAQRIVAVSRFTRDATARLLGTAASGPDGGGRIALIENGVDPRRFCPGPKRPDLLACYGIEGAFVFVSVCRLLEKKGIDHAIRAFASVAADFPDCRYLVVGDGPYRARLEAIAAEAGVAGRVVFSRPGGGGGAGGPLPAGGRVRDAEPGTGERRYRGVRAGVSGSEWLRSAGGGGERGGEPRCGERWGERAGGGRAGRGGDHGGDAADAGGCGAAGGRWRRGGWRWRRRRIGRDGWNGSLRYAHSEPRNEPNRLAASRVDPPRAPPAAVSRS